MPNPPFCGVAVSLHDFIGNHHISPKDFSVTLHFRKCDDLARFEYQLYQEFGPTFLNQHPYRVDWSKPFKIHGINFIVKGPR